MTYEEARPDRLVRKDVAEIPSPRDLEIPIEGAVYEAKGSGRQGKVVAVHERTATVYWENGETLEESLDDLSYVAPGRPDRERG